MVATQETIIIKFLTKGVGRIKKELSAIGKVTTAPMERFKEMTTQTGRMNKRFKEGRTTMGKFAHTMRFATHGLRGFRMEMLGVMFFGMGMARFFTGLLKPAMEMVGIFKIWTTTLAIGFLPIAMMILPILLQFMDWFLNLAPNIQMAIGAIVLFGAILGTIIMLVGMFALGIGSIILLVGMLTPIWGTVVAVLGMFGIAIVVIIAIIVLLWLAFKTNFLGMKDLFIGVWNGIVQVFKGVWETISGIWDIIAGIFTKDWKRVWKGVKKVFHGVVVGIIGGLLKILGSIIKFIVTLPLKLAKYMIEFIAWIIKSLLWIVTHTGEWVPKLIKGIKDVFADIVELAKDLGKQIMESIIAGIKAAWEWAKSLVKGGGREEPEIPSKQLGGFIPRTGLYRMHAGEMVTPSPTINFQADITVNAATGVDATALADEIGSMIEKKMDNLSRR